MRKNDSAQRGRSLQHSFTVFLILLIFFPVLLNALSLEDALAGIPEEAVSALMSDGEVFRFDRDIQGIKLLPRTAMAARIRNNHSSLSPDVFTEGLYLIPFPAGKDSIDLEIYNLTRKVSDSSKVEYYSARKKKVLPLFGNAYAISGLKKKRRIDDPLVSSIPPSDTVLIHMRETNLGNSIYKLDYIYDGENLGFFLENLGVLRFLIKVVDKNNMQISILLIPTDQGFLVYGSCGVRLSNSKTVFNMMDPFSGFYRRLYAMVTWVYNSMHNVNRSPEYGDPLDL